MTEGLFLKDDGDKHLVYRSNIPVPIWLQEPEHALSEGFLRGRRIADFRRGKRYFFNDYFDVTQVDSRERLSGIIYDIEIKDPKKGLVNYGDIMQPRKAVVMAPIAINVTRFR